MVEIGGENMDSYVGLKSNIGYDIECVRELGDTLVCKISNYGGIGIVVSKDVFDYKVAITEKDAKYIDDIISSGMPSSVLFVDEYTALFVRDFDKDFVFLETNYGRYVGRCLRSDWNRACTVEDLNIIPVRDGRKVGTGWENIRAEIVECIYTRRNFYVGDSYFVYECSGKRRFKIVNINTGNVVAIFRVKGRLTQTCLICRRVASMVHCHETGTTVHCIGDNAVYVDWVNGYPSIIRDYRTDKECEEMCVKSVVCTFMKENCFSESNSVNVTCGETKGEYSLLECNGKVIGVTKTKWLSKGEDIKVDCVSDSLDESDYKFKYRLGDIKECLLNGLMPKSFLQYRYVPFKVKKSGICVYDLYEDDVHDGKVKCSIERYNRGYPEYESLDSGDKCEYNGRDYTVLKKIKSTGMARLEGNGLVIEVSINNIL